MIKLYSHYLLLYSFLAIPSLYAQIRDCKPEQLENIEVAKILMDYRGPLYVNYFNKLKDRPKYNRFKGELFLGGDDNFSHTFLYYEPKNIKGASSPLLLIYSGIGGITKLEKYMAKFFVEKGYSVVVSHFLQAENLHNISRYENTMLRTLKVGFSLIDFFSSFGTINLNKIGVIGISFGGIRGLYHIALDQRIKAASLIVAGAPLEEILVHSKMKQVAEIREHHMRSLNTLDLDKYKNTLHNKGLLLQDFLCLRSNSNFLLFISNNDSWVPSRYQWHLWSLLGHPKYEVFKKGHLATPLTVAFKKLGKIHNFFEENW